MIGKQWCPRKWLSNTQFPLACNLLSKKSRLTSGRFCHRCGDTNSITHALESCNELNESTLVDISKMLDNDEDCSIMAERMELRYREFVKSTLFSNLSKRKAKVRIGGEDIDVLCIAPLTQDFRQYRVMYLDDTGVIDTLDMYKLHKEGNLFVETEKVELEDYLL
jgi:hypothetical protein